MIVLTIYGIPRGISAENINILQGTLKTAVAKIKELAIDQAEIICLMPLYYPEPMVIIIPASGWPQSKEVIVFVDGFLAKLEKNDKARNKLAKSLGKVAKKFFPQAAVKVFVRPFNSDLGFWSDK